MLIIKDFSRSDPEKCPYIPERMCSYEYFLALALSDAELNIVLSNSWRKFGCYYFRPSCDGCRSCIPIRVPVNSFVPSKSQRRVIKKNSHVRSELIPLQYSDEIYDIYCEHSMGRFDPNMNTSLQDFTFNFYQQSCPSFQSMYYLDGRLVAVGFLDKSNEALSSVYFIYRMEFSKMSPGIYSILREMEFARSLGLKYYYLGYFVGENMKMSYKNRFKPNEMFSWEEKKWLRVE